MDWKVIAGISSITLIAHSSLVDGIDFVFKSVGFLTPLASLLSMWVSLYFSNLVVLKKFSKNYLKGIFSGLGITFVSFLLASLALSFIFGKFIEPLHYIYIGGFGLLMSLGTSTLLSIGIIKKAKKQKSYLPYN